MKVYKKKKKKPGEYYDQYINVIIKYLNILYEKQINE